MRKVVRVLCYLKELCLMAFFKLFGAVCRCCSAKYRELWLVCERGNDARDNGYWFYRYLKEKHPEINARYVIVLHRLRVRTTRLNILRPAFQLRCVRTSCPF